MTAPIRGRDDLVVALTIPQLRELVADAVREALAEREAPPALIDQRTLARELGVSERTVYALRGEGLPCVRVGESPRFELAAVLAWLKARPNQP